MKCALKENVFLTINTPDLKVPLTLQFVFFWWISISVKNSFSKIFLEILNPFYFTSAKSY